MEIVERRSYLNKVRQCLGKDLIIVLTGQRRVGKSCILKRLASSLFREGNVIYIDKEKHEFESIRESCDLNAWIDSHWQQGGKNFILIDEVQDIKGFETSLRNYYSEPDTEVIVTGSNARMLSSELTTLIAGRYKEIYVQPLSYVEFLEFHRLQENDQALGSYIEFGGMPGLAAVGLDRELSAEYLSDIYHTTLLRDVVMRNEIRNPTFLDKLARFVADNEGKLISSNSISRYLKNSGSTLSPSVIANYLKMLTEAYMVHQVGRYNIHGKRLFESNDKYYFEDHGIRNAIVGGHRDGDIEKVMENIVYQQLVRLGYEVHIGQLQAGEIDFVCTKPAGPRLYIQVAYLIADEKTREREFGTLHKLNDNYPKYVISMNPLAGRRDEQGITHLHLRNFLIEGLGGEDARFL